MPNGGKRAVGTFDYWREAMQKAEDVERAARDGTLPDPRAARATLFRDWVEQVWWPTCGSLPVGTRATYDSRLRHHLLPEFGDVPLAGIDEIMVRQWVGEMALDGAAAESIGGYHALLSSILNLAVPKVLETNPCKGTRLPRPLEYEAVFLDEMELDALLDAHDEYWRPFPLLLAGTGLRWGEAVGLRARYVNLRRSELTVAWKYSSRFGWQDVKSKTSRRTIGFAAPVAAVLAPLLARRGPDDPVFQMPSGIPVHHGYRLGVWRPAVAEAGLGYRAPRVHDLRHTHASILIAAGVPLTAISRRLGHSSTKVTEKVYAHLLPSVDTQMRAALQRIGGARVPDTVPDGLI